MGLRSVAVLIMMAVAYCTASTIPEKSAKDVLYRNPRAAKAKSGQQQIPVTRKTAEEHGREGEVNEECYANVGCTFEELNEIYSESDATEEQLMKKYQGIRFPCTDFACDKTNTKTKLEKQFLGCRCHCKTGFHGEFCTLAYDDSSKSQQEPGAFFSLV